MKSFARWGATAGLIGMTILGSWLGQTAKVLALPEAEIMKLLQSIPVFTLADDKGVPLVSIAKDKKEATAGIFISQQDANQFLAKLQKEQPEVAKPVKVQMLPLSSIYKYVVDNAKKPDGLKFGFIPAQAEVDSAKKILAGSGQEYKGGVPLFVATLGPGEYMQTQFNNEPRIPLYFDQSQAQKLVDQFKKAKPDLAAKLKVEVIPLEALMGSLQKDDEFFKRILIVPSEEALKLLQSMQQKQGAGGQSAQPAPAAKPAQPAQK